MQRAMTIVMAMGVLVVGPAQGAAPAAEAKAAGGLPQPAASEVKLDYGAEFRFRDEMKHELLGPGATAKPFENLLRLRSLLWGSASARNVALYGRLGNEFRVYTSRAGQKKAGMSTYDFPDELYVDNLYLDVKRLFGDRLDLRIGRQDMKYGSSRLISDGSPGDGARAAYFNAIKATLRLTDTVELGAFGIYMPDADEGTIGPYDRPLATLNTSFTDNEEAGAGLYLTVTTYEGFPFELYHIWKNETHSHNVVGAAPPGYDPATGKLPGTPYGRDFHTFGTRLMPKFSDRLSAEVEVAAQVGETDDGRDISAWMGYAGLSYALAPASTAKPAITPAVYTLSGDDKPNKGDDGNWNPVFNRTTWFSVLLADQYRNFRWTNLLYPHLEGSLAVFGNQKVKFHSGPVFCVEDDQASNGTGDDYKGLLLFARCEAPLAKGFLGKASSVVHAVQLEVFEPGDYYTSDETAVFLRWELGAKF